MPTEPHLRATPGHSARPAVETLSPSPTAPEQPDSRDPEDFPPPGLCSCRRLEDGWPRSPVLIVPEAHRPASLISSLLHSPSCLHSGNSCCLLSKHLQQESRGSPHQGQHRCNTCLELQNQMMGVWLWASCATLGPGASPMGRGQELESTQWPSPLGWLCSASLRLSLPTHERVLAALCPAIGWL